MDRETVDKPEKRSRTSKPRTRPSFSAPGEAIEARASAWVDRSPVDLGVVAAEPVPVAAEVVPQIAVVEPPVEVSPPAAVSAAPAPPAPVRREEPIEVRMPPQRPVANPPSPVNAVSATRPGTFTASVGLAYSVMVITTYVAVEMFVFPIRLAGRVFGIRGKS